MIKTIYNFGITLQEEYPEYFHAWQNPFLKNDENAKVIYFNVQNGKINLTPEIENFKKSNTSKYLYRRIQGSRGTNLVPTFYYIFEPTQAKHERNIKKIIDKIKFSFKNFKHDFFDISEINSIIEPLLQMDLNKDDRYLFTFKIDNKWFGEIPQYMELYTSEKPYAKYYEKSNSENKICSVTYEESDVVWGRIDTLGFTVEKKSFSRSGFDSNNSYKMFPVSPKVVKTLEGSKSFILSELTNYFYGLTYFILPHVIAASPEITKEIHKEFLGKSFNPVSDPKKALINTENILSEIFEVEKLSSQNVYYDIFFYQQNKAQILIKLHLADVLPSRLKRIFLEKKQIEIFYQNIAKTVLYKGKKNEKTLDFYCNFNLIKSFFSKIVQKKTVLDPYFFKIVEAIFYNNYLNEKFIINSFLKKIITAFKNVKEEPFALNKAVKESFILHQFLYNLELFQNKTIMEKTQKESLDLTMDGFIDQHASFFSTEYIKGVFMLGCLTQTLLYKQWKKLDNSPFMRNLNNLNLDKKEIKILLPKLVNKLREYDVRIPDLEAKIANSLISDNDVPKHEISYVFTLGMIMQREFSYKKPETISEEN